MSACSAASSFGPRSDATECADSATVILSRAAYAIGSSAAARALPILRRCTAYVSATAASSISAAYALASATAPLSCFSGGVARSDAATARATGPAIRTAPRADRLQAGSIGAGRTQSRRAEGLEPTCRRP